jgi:hypothetical protein
VLSIFHAHAYDATNMLFNAIEKVAVEVDGTLYVPRRRTARRDLRHENHEGITGTLSCDENGDCSAPVIAVYQITQREVGGEWPPEAPIWQVRRVARPAGQRTSRSREMSRALNRPAHPYPIWASAGERADVRTLSSGSPTSRSPPSCGRSASRWC